MILDFLFGWNRKIRKLRRKWDRAREKALMKKQPLRQMVLKRLDGISTNLVTLEESHLNRIERARLSKETEITLEEIKELLKLKPEEAAQLRQKQQAQTRL
ncbi:MAG: hypothetical protein KKA90_00290 [Nanoarchaeota archaeon]|nr:hypothetical protein [Nanoarchaeota archaeon]